MSRYVAPTDPAWLDGASVATGDHWAAFTARHDGLTLSLHASALAHHYEHIRPVRPPHRVRGEGAFVSRNEGIWTVSWIERGAAYALDLECAPLERHECADDATIREFAESREIEPTPEAGSASVRTTWRLRVRRPYSSRKQYWPLK